MSLPAPYPVIVHTYLPSSSSTPTPRPIQAYEHVPDNTNINNKPTIKNALILIGGLGDGPQSLPYARALAARLAASSAGYTVFEPRLSSAFSAFGHGSLAQDARELGELVRYLRREAGVGAGGRRGRVVLMGHSTGCQDCLEYATRFLLDGDRGGRAEGTAEGEKEEEEEAGEEEEWKRERRVDGIVLQGPVSDREAIGMSEDAGEVEASLRVAKRMVEEGRGADVMRKEDLPAGWRGVPVTAERWASLAGVGGADDYFSSDLDDEKLKTIWGRLEQPVLILPSERDEWVPETIDVAGMVSKWKSFCKPGIASELSGLIPGAKHTVDDPEGQKWLADRVAAFLAEIEKQ